MKTIKDNCTNELIINKSKFITLLYRIDNEEDVVNILKDIKNKYKDATHYCYAYIIENIKRCSDDNEPSGTAGIPMLSVLEDNNLNLILGVVVRYFGGKKLGAGGLIRAYRKSINECLKLSETVTLEKGKLVEITFKYEDTKRIDSLLSGYEIVDENYEDLVKYKVIIDDNAMIQLGYLDIKIIKDTYIIK